MDIEDLVYVFEVDNQTVSVVDINHFSSHPVSTWIYLIFVIASTVLGNIGNLLVIITVLTYTKLRIKANVYIVSLAVADLCVTSFVNYFSIVGVIGGYRFFIDRDWLCHLVAFVCNVGCFASVFSVNAIAINRYVCICHHEHYHRIYTKHTVILTTVVLWLLAALIDIPQMTGLFGGHRYDAKAMLCTWDHSVSLSNNLYMTVSMFIPLLMISYVYLRMFLYVRKQRKTIQEMGRCYFQSDVQLAKTLFTIFLVMVLCWFPYIFVSVVDYKEEWPRQLHLFTIMLAHINSSVNSLIYGISNPRFRKGFKTVSRRCLQKRRSNQNKKATDHDCSDMKYLARNS